MAPLAFSDASRCVSVCVRACMLLTRWTCQNLIIGNELQWNFERMLALTYHKQSANISKQNENTVWLFYKRQAIKIQQRSTWLLTTGNRARAKCGGVGLNDFEKISNCNYFDWYCDMIRDITGKDNFYTIILIFIEKHIKMIMVLFLRGSVPN